MWHPPPTIGCPRSVNNFGGGSARYTEINHITLFLNGILRGQSLLSILVYNITSMHAVSHRSEFFACTSRVNIWEPAFCITIILLLAVSRVRLPFLLITTAMSDSKSLYTSLLEVLLSTKNERVFSRDLSDLTSRIIFNALWDSINATSKVLLLGITLDMRLHSNVVCTAELCRLAALES